MGILQKMEEECEGVEVIFQKFVVSRESIQVSMFFEGNDDYKYYWSRISPFTINKTCEHYICKSKKNVIEVQKMIQEHAKEKSDESLLFFVDHDFDKDKQYNENIYVTPVYAIENFYISDTAFSNVIRGEFAFSGEMTDEDMEDYETALKILKKRRDEIVERILFANAWYSLQQNLSTDTQYPRLSAIKEYCSIQNITRIDELESLVTDYAHVTDDLVKSEMEYLREKPLERLRGKYFEKPMATCFNSIFQDSNKKKNRKFFKKRRKININVSGDNMISILSNYADVPESLINYIKEHVS